MSKQTRLTIFLISSFVSAMGDALLVFAVPIGLGLATKDLRATVLMWLIPAIAVYLASFFHRQVAKDARAGRRTYALIVLGVAALEVLISILVHVRFFDSHVVLLISIFIFGYAFIKEGLPRLLFVVSVYNYFADKEEYSRIAGLNHGLNILASLAGTLLASSLIFYSDWKSALIFDAISFLVFGAALLFFGRDVEAPSTSLNENESINHSLNDSKYIAILTGVAILPVANSLVWNYAPILTERFHVANAAYAIALIGVLRLPGMIAGFKITRVRKWFSANSILWIIPAVNLLISILFIAGPNIVLLAALALVQGVVAGVYWPTDYATRNDLGHSALVKFNTHALRRIAIFQMLSCFCALAIYSSESINQPAVIVAVVVGAALAVASARLRILNLNNPVRSAAVIICIFVVGLLVLLRPKSNLADEKTLVLPALSHDLTIRNDLTYSSFVILNDVEAHYVRISKDLSVQPQVIKKFERLDGGQKYILHLDENYMSARGERILAEDVVFSISYFLSQARDVSGALVNIKGADSCHRLNCKLDGLKIVDEKTLSLTLIDSDQKFVEKLTSPWLMIFKVGRPLTEKVGACTVPYQMGHALLAECNETSLTLKFSNTLLHVTAAKEASDKNFLHIVNDNPGVPVSPTLAILTAYANPDSPNLKDGFRLNMMSALRKQARELAAQLKLQYAPLTTARWLGLPVPTDFDIGVISQSKSCPPSPIKVLLDTSLPNLEILRKQISKATVCQVSFSITTADKFFSDFKNSDVGVAWFSPDFLDLYNAFAAFDCGPAGACYFNWHDAELQKKINLLRSSSEAGGSNKEAAIEIERLLKDKGYAAPFAEMNWWIKTPDGYRAIHPAGLGQISASDFL